MDANANEKAPDTAAKIDVEVRKGRTGEGGSLLDAALYNLNIAQQYIDEAEYLMEHRLVSFHHGVALLARYRNNLDKLSVAYQCFSDSANWQIAEGDWEEYGGAYLQIVCESRYNLGVIDELRGRFDEAFQHYRHAIDIDRLMAARWQRAGEPHSQPTGVSILARFGQITSSTASLEESDTLDVRQLNSLSERAARVREQISELRRILENSLHPPMARSIFSMSSRTGDARRASPQLERNEVAYQPDNLALNQIRHKLVEIEERLKRFS